MGLQKIKIIRLSPSGSSEGFITCTFNPETITFSSGASWKKEKIPQETEPSEKYEGGKGATLQINKLLFDAYAASKGKSKANIVSSIQFLHSLLQVPDSSKQGKQQPPFCSVEWGQRKYVPKGILENISTTYTLFDTDGTPLRAEVNLTFGIIGDKVPGQNPTTRTEARRTWVVRGEERLDWIAYQEYGDAAHWRHIAEVNNLDNPFNLQAGQILRLTPLS
jgi:nucleoid-associated protein YgaU